LVTSPSRDDSRKTASLAALHHAIQVAFGWCGVHLHDSRSVGVCLKNLKQVDTDLREDVLDERKQAIAATTVEVGTTFNNQFKF
jgi:hypothetical protein